jgi:hypothetical protein
MEPQLTQLEQPQNLSTKKLIQKLPRDLQLFIYNEYFHLDLIADKIIQMTKTKEAKNLELNNMKILIHSVENLSNELLILLCKKDNAFYQSIKTNTPNKIFALMNYSESVVASWLMILYH